MKHGYAYIGCGTRMICACAYDMLELPIHDVELCVELPICQYFNSSSREVCAR